MRKLKELTLEELKELYKSNHEFSNLVYEHAYSNNMLALEDWGELSKVTKVCDMDCTSYATYILTPKRNGEREGLAVAHKLDKDYLSEEEAKLYDKICELSDLYNNMTYDEQEEWEKKNGDLREQADDLCDRMCSLLTQDASDYENVEEGDIDFVLEEIIEESSYMSEFETENGIVYQTIRKEYK